MFLNIIHLRDIYQSIGVGINQVFIDCIPTKIPHSTLTWPIQTKQFPSAWRLCNRVIKKSVGIQNKNKLIPHFTLGK